jgi:hypothetical protein
LRMQIRTTDKNRERISLVLVVAAVLLGAWACAKVAGFYVQRGQMQNVLTVGQGGPDANSLKQSLGAAQKAANTLKQNNLFVKTPPKENPIKQVDGILGHEVFIAGKWYKVGDQIADAKIVAIEATKVEIAWNGKKTSLSPIGAASAGPPTPPPVAEAPKKEAGPAPAAKPPETKVVKAEAPAPVADDPFAWMGVKLSAKAREKLTQIWSNIPDDQKEKAKEEWNNMPDDKKEEAIQQLERM